MSTSLMLRATVMELQQEEGEQVRFWEGMCSGQNQEVDP